MSRTSDFTAVSLQLVTDTDAPQVYPGKLGYGKGDFVPDLTVNYDIIDKTSNASVASGTFMQMNASDGPHYGANVKLDKAGAYKLVLKIESPEKKGWMLHVDPETGVKGRFWTEPIEVTFPDWNYTPQEW